jgi:uncharacterized protein (DUF433 family)
VGDGRGSIIDELLLIPMYTQTEAAQLIGATQSSLQRWARGYQNPGFAAQGPLVTVERGGRGYTIPFVGLAEAYMLRAFRKAGVPMARIRPTVEKLRDGMGLEHALASERLKTDGAEILWELEGGEKENRLVVVRNNQAVFREVVDEHLKNINYRDGFAGRIVLPGHYGTDVIVDPRVNFGQPTVTDYGVRVDDVLSRVRAGEAVEDVAADYDLPSAAVSNLITA